MCSELRHVGEHFRQKMKLSNATKVVASLGGHFSERHLGRIRGKVRRMYRVGKTGTRLENDADCKKPCIAIRGKKTGKKALW